MTFRKAHFQSGHDLKEFAGKLGIELQAGRRGAMTERPFDRSTSVRPTASAPTCSGSRSRPRAVEPVVIVEDYGYRGEEGGIPRDEERVVLSAPGLVGDRRHGTARVQRPTQGRQGPDGPLAHRHAIWWTGCSGKELCVLAWAAETATEEQIPVICSKWAALRPEERWWLFAMTVAEAGLPEDTQRGWRRALYHALSDGEQPSGWPPPAAGRAGPVRSAALRCWRRPPRLTVRAAGCCTI